MTFSENLRAARIKAGLSKSELAQKAGLARPSLESLENGQVRAPSSRAAIRLAEALGTTVEALIGESAFQTRPSSKERKRQEDIAELAGEDPKAFITAYSAVMKARKSSRDQESSDPGLHGGTP